MAASDGDTIDLEQTTSYLHKEGCSPLGLEHIDDYVKRTKAVIGLSKAKAANVIAYLLMGGLVLSLPLYLLAIAVMPVESSGQVATVFGKWYDVVAPLAGAVVGALFGMTIASRRRGDVR